MATFLIERTVPGASELTPEQLQDIARTSNEAVDGLGVAYTWHQSYVAGDKIYCLHETDDAETIREHARRGGFPADVVVEVAAEFGPADGRRSDDHDHVGRRQRRERRGTARRPGGVRRHAGDRPVPVALDGDVGQRHAQPRRRRDVLRLRRGAAAPHDVRLRHRPPAAVRRAGQRDHAGGVRAGRARRLPHRGHRRRGPAAADPAALGAGQRRGGDGPARHPRRRPGRPQRLQRGHGRLPDRRRRDRGGDRGARRAVAEAVRRLRHPDQPDRRHRHRLLIRVRRDSHAAHDDRGRRGRALRAGHEPLPRRAFGRPRGPRTRRGGELVAHPAVGLAPAAHPELDDPAAGLRLPGRRPGRLPRARPRWRG